MKCKGEVSRCVEVESNLFLKGNLLGIIAIRSNFSVKSQPSLKQCVVAMLQEMGTTANMNNWLVLHMWLLESWKRALNEGMKTLVVQQVVQNNACKDFIKDCYKIEWSPEVFLVREQIKSCFTEKSTWHCTWLGREILVVCGKTWELESQKGMNLPWCFEVIQSLLHLAGFSLPKLQSSLVFLGMKNYVWPEEMQFFFKRPWF